MAVIDVHARDVMGKMAEAGVSSKADFDWISQMRYLLMEAPVNNRDAAVVHPSLTLF